jgi:hypothetical protein
MQQINQVLFYQKLRFEKAIVAIKDRISNSLPDNACLIPCIILMDLIINRNVLS